MKRRTLKFLAARSIEATAGYVIARVTNILIPFAVFAFYPPGSETDHFFIALTIAFYFYGTIANALTDASVPLAVAKKPSPFLGNNWRRISAGIALTVMAIFIALIPGGTSLAAVGMGLMIYASLISAYIAAVLYSEHRYFVAGISWTLRLVALGIFVMLPTTIGLSGLFLIIGVADLVRAQILKQNFHNEPNTIPFSKDHVSRYFFLLASSAISGVMPIIDRAVAAALYPGALSVLELADRFYGLLANLVAAGTMMVLLTTLSKAHNEGILEENWRHVLASGFVWGLLCAIFGYTLVVTVLPMAINNLTSFDAKQTNTVLTLCKIYLFGLPTSMVNLIFIRRFIATGSYKKMIPIALMSVFLDTVSAITLSRFFGIVGIATAATITSITMTAVLALAGRRRPSVSVETVK